MTGTVAFADLKTLESVGGERRCEKNGYTLCTTERTKNESIMLARKK